MTGTYQSLQRGVVLLSTLLFAGALLLSASPAEAGWMPKHGAAVASGVAVGGVARSLKKNIGEATDQVGELLNAFFREDTDEVNRISEEFKRLSGKLGMDAFPVLSIGTGALDAASGAREKLKKRLEAAKRTLGGLADKVGETIGDVRVALAIHPDERPWYESEPRVLGKARLPAVTVSRSRQGPDPYPSSLAAAWGMDAETIRRSRDPGAYAAKPDPWGQDAGPGWDSPAAAPVATRTDVWSDDAGEGEQSRRARASIAGADPWSQDAGQKWDSPSGMPVAADAGDEQADTQWQNEYASALNHLLGREDDDSSYEAALSTVERLELEAVRRQEERERQARLAAAERERKARLEAAEGERQARLEEERRERRARQSAEATRAGIVSGVLSGLALAQGQLDIAQEHIALAQQLEDQRRRAEAERRQRLAAIQREQEQQRQAEQERYRLQQRHQQEQMRRQAEEQERQRREAERRRVEEQERQRRIAEEQRKEAERQAKAMRRQACLQRISGSRNGCVQPIRERGGSDWYDYFFRNNCNYPIAVYFGGQGDARLSSVTHVSPRSKSAYLRPKGRLRYAACYHDPGISGPSCEIMSWACTE